VAGRRWRWRRAVGLAGGERGWWQAYGSAAVPEWFQAYVGLEAEASSIREYGAELMPGLLQTADYYRAFARATPAVGNDDEIERKIAVRMTRQERLRNDEPPTLWAVLNEAVIRRVVGGAETMRAQLRHVAEMAELPHVSVQVLPFRGAPLRPPQRGERLPMRRGYGTRHQPNHTDTVCKVRPQRIHAGFTPLCRSRRGRLRATCMTRR
jgi:Domain of unknown function (DUF5753)